MIRYLISSLKYKFFIILMQLIETQFFNISSTSNNARFFHEKFICEKSSYGIIFPPIGIKPTL